MSKNLIKSCILFRLLSAMYDILIDVDLLYESDQNSALALEGNPSLLNCDSLG